MRPSGTAEARAGGIARIRLIIELDGLVQRFGRLVPDAAGLLAQIARIQRQASGVHPALDVRLARFGGGAADEVAADWHALHPGVVAELPAFELVRYEDAARCRSEDRDTGVMVLAGREQVARDALAARIPAWLVSDRAPEDHRQLAIGEAPRVIAEALRIPAPRTMDDANLTGTLVALPVAGPSDARDLGLAVLRLDPRADWFVLGAEQIVFSAMPEAIDELARRAGARHLATDVRRSALRLAPTANIEAQGAVLAEWRGARLGPLEGAGTLDWGSIRRTHRVAPDCEWQDQPRLPSLSAAIARGRSAGKPDAFVPAILAGEKPSQIIAWPHANQQSDTVLAVALGDSHSPGEASRLTALAAEMSERCGGAAIVLVLGGDDVEALVDRALWRAERNNLTAIVDTRGVHPPFPTGSTPMALKIPVVAVLPDPDRPMEALPLVVAEAVSELSQRAGSELRSNRSGNSL